MLRIKSIRSLIKLTGCVGVLLVLFVSPALPGDPNAADYSTDNDRIFWFILVSDTHIGARGSQDSNNLKWIVTEGMNVVQPEFVVLAGDLTDSTNGNWFGYPNGPYQQEWDEYKSILAQGNVNSNNFYDIPGNHDAYSDQYFRYYLANSVQGQTTGFTQVSWTRKFDFGNYHFLGVNTADNTGASFSLSWPYGDYAGLDKSELAYIWEELTSHSDHDLTLVFGHHPVTDTGGSTDTWLYYGAQDFIGMLDFYGASLYGYGHTHNYSEVLFQGDSYTGYMVGDGIVYLNVDSVGKSSDNNFTVVAVDCNGISTKTQAIGKWPLVLVTTPVNYNLGGVSNPYAYSIPTASDNPIRALVFDAADVSQVQYRIDNGVWNYMQQISSENRNLWEASWDTTALSEGMYTIEVQATGTTVNSDIISVYVTSNVVNNPPVANNQSVTTNEDEPVDITLKADDPDGDNLTYEVGSGPSHGSLSGIAPNLTYTPNADYHGEDSFTFKAHDGSAYSDIATVTITVLPINDPPVVGITSPDDFASFESGTSISFAGTANDIEDGDLTAQLIWTSDRDGQIGKGGSFNTVLSDGQHIITASVIDSGDLTGSDSITISVVGGSGGDIVLSVTANKIRGTKYADLTWSGATSTNMDIYRDDNLITTTANDGAYTDGPLGKGGGSAAYNVCEAGTSTCSNIVSVSW
jgi:predicted phosphodiesterase